MPIQPPRPRMPHLGSLRAFEAAARLESFSGAATELFVTPAAVAQQVKSLEAWAGAKLFKRNPQGIELTPLGAKVLADFQAAFDQLGLAVRKLRSEATPLEVRIAALPSIAQLWLSPRLPAIRRANSNVSISVSAVEQKPNLVREPFDLAIFYEDISLSPIATYSDDRDAIELGRDVIFPVCSPEVGTRLNSIGSLADIAFLHDTTWKTDWKMWLTHAQGNTNAAKITVQPGPEFSLYALALEECKNGAGVMIGRQHLVQPHLDAGTLVAPFSQKVKLAQKLTISSAEPLVEDTVVANIVNMLAIT